MSLEKFTIPSVIDNEETRAALKRARDELMTPDPNLVADLLEGIAAHVALIKSDKVELDVNGIKDPNRDITYIGKATKMEDGTWRCLANVEGALCLVEINIKPSKEDPRASVFCCSFCGKSANECEVIVAGPMVNICDECVQIAKNIVDDKVEERKSKGETATHAMIEFSRCLDRKSSKKISPKFIPPPGEFSGCRCPHCPERAGTGECRCCAERREEEKNPGPEPFI